MLQFILTTTPSLGTLVMTVVNLSLLSEADITNTSLEQYGNQFRQ